MRWLKFLLMPLVVISWIPAQAAGGGEDPEPEDGCFAYCVMIYPRSGDKYEAVIRDPSLIALLKEHGSLDSTKRDPETRVTLHYMRGLNGSMSIRLKDVSSIAALMPLSKEDYQEVKEVIGQRIKKGNEKESARIEAMRKKRAQAKKEHEAALERERLKREAEEKKKARMKRFPLLVRFPPDQGWSRALKEEIERRKIVIKIFPKPEEQAFLDCFEAWEKQLKEWKSLDTQEDPAESPAGREAQNK